MYTRKQSALFGEDDKWYSNLPGKKYIKSANDTVTSIPWQRVLPVAAAALGGLYVGSSMGPSFSQGVNTFASRGFSKGRDPMAAPDVYNAAYFRQYPQYN